MLGGVLLFVYAQLICTTSKAQIFFLWIFSSFGLKASDTYLFFFYCFMWPLKRNLVKRCRSLLSVMLLCGVYVLLLRSYTLRCVAWCVSRCVTLCCIIWLGSVWLLCIVMRFAVIGRAVLCLASCARNVSAHGKRPMLSVDGSEWVNTFFVFRLVNVAETLAVSPPKLLTVGMIYPFSLWFIVSNFNLSPEGPYRCEQDGHTVNFRK